jgi:anti-sigma regulatory factor (Ser/Thr protein kinase)
VLTRWLEDLEVSRALSAEIVMAVHEASTNVVEHAYGPAGGIVTITVTRNGEHVEAWIRDSGTWRGASKGDRGNGLKLMRGLMDDVIVDTSAAGTVVLLRRRTAA